jgi:osmotically-inducible protein OsmY
MTYRSDETILGEVMFQLDWDSRIKQTEVGVTVNNGVVNLTGKVDSYAEKLAAQQAAHRASGVLDVVNHIEVQVPGDAQNDDAEIARALRHALEWNVLVPAARINSTVSNGWVTLTGEVDCIRERADAERAVSVLPGVRGVFNHLEVKTSVDPEDLKFMIADVLARRADREAQRIRVEVDEEGVILTGAVNSWDEKEALLGAISHAPGVTRLTDHLFINPYAIRFEAARATDVHQL